MDRCARREGIGQDVDLVTPLVKMIARWAPFDFANMTRVFDPLTFGASVAFVIVACLLASAIPALRATRVDPIETLRND